jgi:hypothetical protein
MSRAVRRHTCVVAQRLDIHLIYETSIQVRGINLYTGQASPLDLDYTMATTKQVPNLKVTRQVCILDRPRFRA